jgi:uncharacterized protein
MNSRLYTGWVTHSRSLPVRNAFSYQVYFLYLDLDELDELDDRLRTFSHVRGAAPARRLGRGGLVSFHDADHGPRDGSPLRPWIDGQLARAGVDLEGGAVRILSIPRVLGGRFYPVSFWYCFHADGTPRAVLAEVQNTFRDHHSYLLHNNGAPFDWQSRPRSEKAFYVSPFVPIDDVGYVFAFTQPAESVSVSVTNRTEGKVLLGTTLSLSAQELTDADLTRVVLRLGPMSARALVLIYWQALRLFAKRLPYHRHVSPVGEEVSLHALPLGEESSA